MFYVHSGYALVRDVFLRQCCVMFATYNRYKSYRIRMIHVWKSIGWQSLLMNQPCQEVVSMFTIVNMKTLSSGDQLSWVISGVDLGQRIHMIDTIAILFPNGSLKYLNKYEFAKLFTANVLMCFLHHFSVFKKQTVFLLHNFQGLFTAETETRNIFLCQSYVKFDVLQ